MSAPTKTLLFLDDWFIDARLDVVRHLARPVFTREVTAPRSPGEPPRVMWHPARQCYETTVGYGGPRPVVKESTDGLTWHTAPRRTLELLGPEPEGFRFDPHVVLAPYGGYDVCSPILDDPWDPDPARRYKRLFFPFTHLASGRWGVEAGLGMVGCSADGLHWTIDPRHRWYDVPNGSDTLNNLIFDPRRKLWMAFCRRCNCDRRIAVTESPDLEHWTEPRVILHPDALDPDGLQFYAMPALYHEGTFIGMAQRYLVPCEDTAEPRWAKMSGKTDGQLAYSYDGQTWMRPTREASIPRSQPGQPGPRGSVYPIQFRPEPRRLVIMGLSFSQHHALPNIQTPTAEYELRPDGFCYLEPVGDCGEVHLRAICPRDRGRITLNLQTERHGYLLARVVEFETFSGYRTIPGYDFEDCLPVGGDHLAAKLRWRQHPDLSALAGRRVRLELRLYDARLYALRAECALWYTNTPEPVEWV